MAVAEDIGPDVDLLADDSFDWKTTSIDDGVNVFDVDAMFGKVADRPDAGVSCHGSMALCRPVDPPGRRKGTDGTWTRPVLFQAIFEGRVTLENVKSYRANHPVLAEQTRIALVVGRSIQTKPFAPHARSGLSIARRDHGPRF